MKLSFWGGHREKQKQPVTDLYSVVCLELHLLADKRTISIFLFIAFGIYDIKECKV